MTKYVLIISIGLIVLTLFSCVRNNGGDSSLYGNWKLQRVTRAGVDDSDYKGGIFWKFQNQTVEMRQVDELHNATYTFGNYRMSDNTLFLSFPDPTMPPMLSLPRECEMQIVRLKGSEMVLSFGEPATMYYFKKW